MRTKLRFIICASAALAIIVAAVITFLPVNDVNVVFDRCVNPNELAAVFSGTMFKSYQYYSVTDTGVEMSRTNNSQLFGTPPEVTELNTALSSEPPNTGIIVLDGSVSLIDIAKIKKNAFVDEVILYFPILDMGDRDILPESTSKFFEKHPETRYWE